MITKGADLTTEKLSKKKRELLNLEVMIFSIHETVVNKLRMDLSISLQLNKQIINALKSKNIFKDGIKFTTLKNKILAK